MPGSGANIFKKLFGKNKKPLNMQRVVIPGAQKDGFKNNAGSARGPEPSDVFDLHEDTFLEDTPAEGVLFGKAAKGKHRGKSASPKIEDFRGEKSASLKTEGFRGGKDIEKPIFAGINTEKRYNKSKKSIFSVFSAIPRIFSGKSKTGNSSALEFAANKKRLGRKGRRNKRIFIYAGTGLAVVVLTLVIVFVPGLAAPTENPGVSQQLTPASYMAQNTAAVSESGAVSASPSISPSVSPTPTRTPIPTTSHDITPPPIDINKEIQTFRVEADKYYNKMGYSNNHYKYTPDEFKMLAQVIWAEARGEPREGQIAVGNVIMNRVLNKSKFGNTIAAVITASGQFAYPSAYNPALPTSPSSRAAARDVLDFEKWVIPQNTYYFRVSSSTDYWHGTFLRKIDHHAFYTSNYSGRSTVKSVPPRLFERTFEWPTVGCKPEIRVYKLQYMLNKLGYNVKADNYFGQDTKDAVIDFQKKHGLDDDGIAGERTLKELIKEFGLENYYELLQKIEKG